MKSRVAVIVQCRLSSTRLPGKALKNLGGESVLSWTLDAMKKIPAERYFLACDYDSENALEKIAKDCGWEIFAGSRDDVLERFCSLVKTRFPECETIVRATADNPFLFYEAAQKSLEEFEENFSDADYFTFTGLPHGSGVEVFKAASLLRAAALTDSPYDHEHVGPSLYNHPENFKSIFKKADGEFFAPDLRTTIDTFSDFKRAQKIVQKISGGKKTRPYSAQEILFACEDVFVKKNVLFVPSVRAGRGTGHLRRCLDFAKKIGGFVYIEPDSDLKECDAILEEAVERGLNEFQIIRPAKNADDFSIEKMLSHSATWDLIVADLFKSEKSQLQKLSALGSLCSIDDGGKCDAADFLLDIIPSYNLRRAPNLQNPALVPLPKNRKAARSVSVKNALVAIGGEGNVEISLSAARALSKNKIDVTVILPGELPFEKKFGNEKIKIVPPVCDLRERLFEYDLIFTHYGFTAFEAVAAGCRVILFATSALHKKLSKKYGLVCVEKNEISEKKMRALLENPSRLTSEYFEKIFSENENEIPREKKFGWNEILQSLALAQKFDCPVCGEKSSHGKIVARTAAHTFRRCLKCKMIYLAFSTDSRVQYEKNYFEGEYKNQYGRTYLEDFDSIKSQGARRVRIIKKILEKNFLAKNSASKNKIAGATINYSPSTIHYSLSNINLLDVGCAYGPFLSAASEAGFSPFGSDISVTAVNYVKNDLGFSCVNASFLDFDSEKEFGVSQFDALTMWFVIEHIQDLKSALTSANKFLKKGGVFAFSTPSASGVSARFSRQKFFEQSPRDHYSIWEIRRSKKILKMFGFKIKKIVSTGIHAERIPFFKKREIQKGTFLFSFAVILCKMFKLGDTYEVYCVKN
ncbi:MAG: methyltransferase domain-containing protein [Treponemataceae bacterium]|nr:methyltransferase domain-containing protein [Treponemataceae bacterium]